VLAIVPDNPETVMFEGYGVAAPGTVLVPLPVASLIVIGAELVKVFCAKAATLKTAKIKIKLLKKDKTFIVSPRKIKNQKVL
jgi:hypothetical protein